jgi:putative FmdB family regulatory protein
VPLYDYRCAGCGREFEALVATAAKADEERCPDCGAEARRLLSLVAAPVRGGGVRGTPEGFPGGSSFGAAAPVAGGGCCGGACGHCG